MHFHAGAPHGLNLSRTTETGTFWCSPYKSASPAQGTEQVGKGGEQMEGTNISHQAHLSSKSVCVCVCAYICAQSCLTLCDSIDCSPPSFSAHGISQARKLKWVAIPFPRGSSRPIDQTQVSCDSCPESCLLHWQVDSLPQCHPFSN